MWFNRSGWLISAAVLASMSGSVSAQQLLASSPRPFTTTFEGFPSDTETVPIVFQHFETFFIDSSDSSLPPIRELPLDASSTQFSITAGDGALFTESVTFLSDDLNGLFVLLEPIPDAGGISVLTLLDEDGLVLEPEVSSLAKAQITALVLDVEISSIDNVTLSSDIPGIDVNVALTIEVQGFIPEPSTLGALLLGVTGIGWRRGADHGSRLKIEP
ncbi:MAG: PEP-CTERM sorting domain-containing protein [Planctomycetota bacterium]